MVHDMLAVSADWHARYDPFVAELRERLAKHGFVLISTDIGRRHHAEGGRAFWIVTYENRKHRYFILEVDVDDPPCAQAKPVAKTVVKVHKRKKKARKKARLLTQ